jgi:hypothetical protein
MQNQPISLLNYSPLQISMIAWIFDKKEMPNVHMGLLGSPDKFIQ